MNSVIEDINSRLKTIIDELEQKEQASKDSLSVVQAKIDEKIAEAKKYKVDVDDAKENIKAAEKEIETLKVDLKDLNDRFGNKNLSAVVDAGNREINGKIAENQVEITKNRDKINELTDRARTIKDLLINLKKDKEGKKNKLDSLTNCLNYYKNSLLNIINYSESNPDNLVPIDIDTNNIKSEVEEKVIPKKDIEDDDSPIFDEIASLTGEGEKTSTKTSDDIDLFTNDTKEAPMPEDLQKINDSIDKEYASIFGSSEAITIPEQEASTPQKEPKNIFDQNDLQEERETKTSISANNIKPIIPSVEEISDDSFKPILEDVDTVNVEPLAPPPVSANSNEIKDIFGNKVNPPTNSEDDAKLVNYFTNLGIDYYSFKLSSQDYLKKVFNEEKFNKILSILKKYNIDIDAIYTSPNIFGESTPDELERVISKLVECGQSTSNIAYVLNTLPLINSFDLNEVIDSYGQLIKNTSITEIIIKAKHLNDIGGGVS